jgi:hypothetical protein
MIRRSQLPPQICDAIAAIQQQNKLGLLLVEGQSDRQFLMHHLKLNEKVEIISCNGKKPAIDFYRQVKVSHEVDEYWIGLLVDHDHDFLGEHIELCSDMSIGNIIVVDRPTVSDNPTTIDLEGALPTEKMEGIVGILDSQTKVNVLARLKSLAALLHHLRGQRFENGKRLSIGMAPCRFEDILPEWHKCLGIKSALPYWKLDALSSTVIPSEFSDRNRTEVMNRFNSLSQNGMEGPYKGHDLMFLAYWYMSNSTSTYLDQATLTTNGFCKYQAALLRSLDKDLVLDLDFVNRLVRSIESTRKSS